MALEQHPAPPAPNPNPRVRHPLLGSRVFNGERKPTMIWREKQKKGECNPNLSSQSHHQGDLKYEMREIKAPEICRSSSGITQSDTTRIFLPDELLVDILSRLPVKSLGRLRCLCKRWCSLIYDPSFAHAQLKRSTGRSQIMRIYCSGMVTFYDFVPDGKIKECFSKNSIEGDHTLSNSVNGLTCASSNRRDGYDYLLNPTTGDHLKISESPIWRLVTESVGLGFDASIGKYKIVRIFTHDLLRPYLCEVLTVGSSEGWRYVGDVPRCSIDGRPVFAYGALHWKSYSHPTIHTFDIKNEKFGIISTPPTCGSSMTMDLTESGGHLYLVDGKFYKTRFEIWILKDYDGQEWKKICSIDTDISRKVNLHVIGIAHEKILFELSGEKTCEIICYDCQSQAFSKFCCGANFSFYIHTESLLCPKKLLSSPAENFSILSRQ